MPFLIRLNCAALSDGSEKLSVRSDSGQDYEALVMEACEELAERSGCRFYIGGFGDDEWLLDVGYDLSAFMEQFVELIDGIRRRNPVELDLYPPGVERTLIFESVEDLVRVKCRSRTSWRPDPDIEYLPHGDLVSMLETLAIDFSRALEALGSEIADAPPFCDWRRGIV